MSGLIQAVLVLYKQTISESKTARSLSAALAHSPELRLDIRTIFYDNSPESEITSPGGLALEDEYIRDTHNGGLAAAYSYGLQRAKASGCEWLLLLDQDSSLSEEFLRELVDAIEANKDERLGVIAPRLVRRGELLSPKRPQVSITEPFRHRAEGRPMTILNSCACIRLSALEAIGGFPREYWLDFLDHIVFYRLQTRGWKLKTLEIEIEHELSIKNFAKEMSLERYKNVLDAEMRFVNETVPFVRRLSHRLLLIARSFGLVITIPDKRFARATLHRAISRE